MSELSKFDSFIKGEFDKYEPEVPPHVYENILAEQERRRPKGFWWMLRNNATMVIGVAAFLTLLLVGTSYMLTENGTGKEIHQTTEKTVAAKSQVVRNKDIVVSTLPTSTNDNIVVASKREANPVTLNQGNIADNKSTKVNVVHSYDNIKVGKQKNVVVKTSGLPVVIDVNDAVNDNNTLAENNDIITDQMVDVSAPRFEKLSSEKFKQLIAGNTVNKRTFPNVAIPDCPTIEKDAAGNKKYFEVYVSPDFILRNFTDTPSSVFMQKRKESTTINSAFSAGIRYTKIFNNGVGVKLGLNYSQINEQFSFIQSNLVQITYIIDPVSGDTTGSYTVTGSRRKVTNNKYRFIDIPILLGYEIGNGRLKVNLNAGGMINVYSWQKGEVLNANLLPESITTGKSSSRYSFKNNIGISLTAGAGVYYKLNDYLQVLAEPYFRYSLQSLNEEVSSYKQKYHTAGIRIGLRFDLQ